MATNDSSRQEPSVLSTIERGNGIVSLVIDDEAGENCLTAVMVEQLKRALAELGSAPGLAAVVLEGRADVFLSGGRESCDPGLTAELFEAVQAFPAFIIAAMRGRATGAGLVIAALCDFMVFSRDAEYGFSDRAELLVPRAAELDFLEARLGRGLARRLLHAGNPLAASTWLASGWTGRVASDDCVVEQACVLARELVAQAPAPSAMLRRHLRAPLTRMMAAWRQPRVPAALAAVGFDAEAADEVSLPTGSCLLVDMPTAGVARVRISGTEVSTESPGQVVDALASLFDALHDGVCQVQTLVLTSDFEGILPQGSDQEMLVAAQRLQELAAGVSVPVIVALPVRTDVKGWVVGLGFDAVVHDVAMQYSLETLTGADEGWTVLAAQALLPRLGSTGTRELVLGARSLSGAELADRCFSFATAAGQEVQERAVALARNWANWPGREGFTVRDLKFEMPVSPADLAARDALNPTAVHLRRIVTGSSVVTAEVDAATGVVRVEMADRTSRNLFTPALVEGLDRTFAEIAADATCKVVLLTGDERYFATGGTRQSLEALQSGQGRFTDQPVFLTALRCPIPVVACLKGHAVGGGFSLGLFADFALMATQSQYLNPYLRYGFTPGGGATLIVPEALGRDLGAETLLTAREFSGAELRERNRSLWIQSRERMDEQASALALRIARLSRPLLMALKAYLNQSLLDRIEPAMREEVAMHEQSLVGQQDALERIRSHFSPEIDATANPSLRSSEQTLTMNDATPAQSRASAPSRSDIAGQLRMFLAQELHLQENEIEDAIPFVDLGLDSITGVTWVRKINARFAIDLPATRVYRYPTLAELTDHVQSLLAARQDAVGTEAHPVAVAIENEPAAVPASALDSGAFAVSGATAAPSNSTKQSSGASEEVHAGDCVDADITVEWAQLLAERQPLTGWRTTRGAASGRATMSPGRTDDAIAVIGMAGQFPQARSLSAYWSNLLEGRLCVEEVPSERWDVRAYYQPGDPAPGKINAKWMGSLEDYDRFDPLFFDISPKEAVSMDPQQRLFLQACWHAIENAGYNPRAWSGARCGVFVGCGQGDYHLISTDLQTSALGFTGNDTAILAARVSYFLNLRGPCLSVETACSSSLVAIATACDSLKGGNCDLAIAGGVGIISTPHLFIKMAQTGMLSPDGRCFTFDHRANGFVPGEAVGAIVLKRLRDAERDGDIVVGVIHGWGVNQDGRTNGITAPNPDAQVLLQQDVHARFGIDPNRIQMVEAHGTGTKLGDPIEVEALKQTFGTREQHDHGCALGSVKSNIGHCFTAAGVASVIKVLLSMQNRMLPPTINFERLNEHIDLAGSPFYVNDRARPWPVQADGLRLAAVSGFGFGGTNAYLVLGDRPQPASIEGEASWACPGAVPIVLSARTPEQLLEQAQQLLEVLTTQASVISLPSLAYTLQVGREAMEERLGILAGSLDHLVNILRRFVSGDAKDDGLFQASVRANREAMVLFQQDPAICAVMIDRLVEQADTRRLVELWCKGLPVDWRRLWGLSAPRRVALPGYPFARERYWIDATPDRVPHGDGTAHPLLQRNASTLLHGRYSARFDGSEAYLRQADTEGPTRFPAAALLEMARAAAQRALGLAVNEALDLSKVVWGQPYLCGTDRQPLQITLVLVEDDCLEFEIHSNADGGEIVHLQGTAQRARGLAGGVDDSLGGTVVDVELVLPDIGVNADEVLVHPLLLDSLLASIGPDTPMIAGARRSLQPDTLSQLQMTGSCHGRLSARIAATSTADGEFSLSIMLHDAAGRCCATFIGLSLVERSGPTARTAGTEVVVTTGIPTQGGATLPTRVELLRALRESLARVLYLPSTDIPYDKPFIELGMDSIVGVEWISQLNSTYGTQLVAARLYDYPNLDEFSTFLEGEVHAAAPQAVPDVSVPDTRMVLDPATEPTTGEPRRLSRSIAASVPARRAAPGQGSGKIAVIGMSGRYPQARDLRQFWENLRDGRNAITEVPPTRWDIDTYYDPDPSKPDRTYCKWIGMLDDIDAFDPLFFRVSPAEAKNMDPQHRLFLEEAYHAFEHAGYARHTLSNSKCGVYVGIIGTEYASLVSHADDITGNNPAIGAARIAYFLNLKGPAIAIDTACSASLVAIHLACQGLIKRETDMALAGGVSIYLQPETYMGMCKAGMLSPDGKCHTFDDGANGFVPGEGVGAVVLKRLEDAERDRDMIYGVILGSAINQDGKTNGITAPSVNSQAELERGLYAALDIDPETITYVETHGTGTRLGDPIELEALSTVFREHTEKRNFCALGSVKSNIGHASGAAGVASVQKVLLCLQHGVLVPSLNIKKENTLFDFAHSPFYVSRDTQPWPVAERSPRRAAVSSFGFSGTNAHLVVEEYVRSSDAGAATSSTPVPIVLSARTEKQLRQRAEDLLAFVDGQRRSGSTDLLSMVFTLLEGREAFDERLALIVHSIGELADALGEYLIGGGAGISGRVARDEDGLPLTAEEVQSTGDPAVDIPALARAWVVGGRLAWTQLLLGPEPRRMALPTYPFGRRRYWVDQPASNRATAIPAEATSMEDSTVLPTMLALATTSERTHPVAASALAAFAKRSDGSLSAASVLMLARRMLLETTSLPDVGALSEVAWGEPLVPSPEREVQVTVFQHGGNRWAFEVHSRNCRGDVDEEQIHCQGWADPSAIMRGEVDLQDLRTRMSGSSLRTSADAGDVEVGEGEALVRVPLASVAVGDQGPHATILDEIHLDAVLSAVSDRFGGSGDGAEAWRDPEFVACLHGASFASPPESVWAWIRRQAKGALATMGPIIDVTVCGEDGRALLRIDGLRYSVTINEFGDAPGAGAASGSNTQAFAQLEPSSASDARPRVSLPELL